MEVLLKSRNYFNKPRVLGADHWWKRGLRRRHLHISIALY